MRLVLTSAMLLAVVATALVAVCQHSETRRLQRHVWQLEKRRVRLERQAERLSAAIQATRTPRRLLVEHDLELIDLMGGPFGDDVEAEVEVDWPLPLPQPAPAPQAERIEARLPAGFVSGGNFEGGGR